MNIDIKSLLAVSKDKSNLDLLLNQSNRVKHAILSLLVWHNSKSEKFPAIVTGSSGSSKSFITVALFEALLGKDSVKHIVPPSDGSYGDFIHNQIAAKHYEMIIIDESHKLDFDIETIQPHKKSLVIGETSINYGNLIFITHSGMGRNSSEDARLVKIEYGTPERDEIIDLLMEFEGYSKDKATWCAWHSPRNIHNGKTVSDKYGTQLQDTVLPCGLLSQDLAVLLYYKDSNPLGSNTISSCSGKLCLDIKAVQNSERRLKGEGFLVVGKQNKRDVTELGFDLLYTLDKRSKKSETQAQPSKAKPKPSAKPSKVKAKAKPKQVKTPSAKPSKPSKAQKAATSSVSESYSDFRNSIVIPDNPLDKLDN